MRSMFATLVYRCYIAACVWRQSRGVAGESRAVGLLRRLRERLVAGGDPVVRMRVGKRKISMPLSHNLPLYSAIVPAYDRELPSLARRVREHAGRLVMIDVGANVGDTAALVTDAVPDAALLCIEGSLRYFTLLERNVRDFGGVVTLVQAFCGDATGASLEAHEHGGTGGLRPVAGGAARVDIRTLDDIIATNASFADANLLKVDTDGFDAKVLRGATAFLLRAQPVLFFEYAEQLMKEVGDDPAAMFSSLRVLGYTHAELFANHGSFLGRFDLTGGEIVAAAADAVQAGKADYVDVVAWPDRWSGVFGQAR
jgi:FkbM family methyltransferase